MNLEIAKEYIQDIIGGGLDQCHEEELCKLVMWAYELGWQDGIADYREDENPTDSEAWRKSR